MRHLLSFLLLSCFLFSCSEDNPSINIAKEEAKPLNIIWLVAEDMSNYIPAFGDNTVETPNLSRLAAEGVCYDNFFTPAPVCAPARSAISTGMYPTKIGTMHMRTGPWHSYDISSMLKDGRVPFFPENLKVYEAMPEPEVKMMSEYLRKVGYYCTNNNKKDYQYRYTLTAWDETSTTAHWRNRAEGQPFFSIFNFEVCHESRIWKKANDSLWVDENLEVPVPPYLPDTEVGKKDVRRMYSNVKEMDYQVGEILKQLEEDGLMEETVIFWYTDHGGPLPRQKRLLYDSGLHVPMIIRFPNKENGGTRNDEILNFIDLAPTTLSIADITPPKYMDGKAFLGNHKQIDGRAYTFAAADRFDKQYDTNRAIRDKRYKLIRYYQQDKPMFLPVAYREQMPIMRELHRLKKENKLTPAQALWFRASKPEIEFFDTETDPHEVNNLADDPAHQSKIEEMSLALDGWLAYTDDRGLKDEVEYFNSIWPNGIQPQTAIPSFNNLGEQVSISSETKGASIAYQIAKPGQQAPKTWSVYNGALDWTTGDTLKVVAHRLGYLPTETTIFIP